MSGERVSSQTPLAALPVLVLDLETTGLDVRAARVVQIGAVAQCGASVEDAQRIDCLVAPGLPIPEAATRVHGIGDADVAAAATIEACLPVLAGALSGRVVVGHHVGFDLAILAAEASRCGVGWTPPDFLDVALLAGALDPSLPDLGLETVASRLAVTVEGRHSALGDARTAARVFAALLPVLAGKGIRTLGEARSFARSRDDLVQRQSQAGWALPADPTPVAEPPLALDGYLFTRTLGDVMSAPPVFIAPDATLGEAARCMAQRRIGALLVGAPALPPAGIVTERDLLLCVAGEAGDPARVSVGEVMSTPVAGMAVQALIYRALGRMDRRRVRHLAVFDDEGVAVGMVSQRDMLEHRARTVGALGDALATGGTEAELASAFGQVPRVAEALVAEGLDGRDVARVVACELCALTARAAEIVAARLARDGPGPAPAPWCLLVLGSGGRGESLLGADQDNALVHAGSPDDDAWYAALGDGVADLLHAVGVPRCQGGIMAANPAWRGNDEVWRARVGGWLQHAGPEDLLNVDVFFDLAPVAGDARLATGLHAAAVARAARTPAFLNLLAASVQGLAPRFGLLGGLLGHLPDVEGRVDLKRDGLLPLTCLARTLALRTGSTARDTPARLAAAASAGRLPDGDARTLTALHAELLDLVLHQQLEDVAASTPPSSRVDLGRLPRVRRRELIGRLKTLAGVIGEVRGAMAS